MLTISTNKATITIIAIATAIQCQGLRFIRVFILHFFPVFLDAERDMRPTPVLGYRRRSNGFVDIHAHRFAKEPG